MYMFHLQQPLSRGSVCVFLCGGRAGRDATPTLASSSLTALPSPRLRICTPSLWTPRAPRSREEVRTGRRAVRNQLQDLEAEGL